MHRTQSAAPRTTTRKKAAIAAGLAATAALGALATAQAADASTATAAAPATTPYVVNHYGEQNADKGHPERSPKNLVLSEFTSAGGLHWQQWGAKKAVATGKITGNWCLDTCLDKPLKATVTLSDPKTVHGKRVFSRFTLHLSGKPGAYDSVEDLQGKRPLATS
ncbi:hypothetical protein [Streptomyces gilvosporeus]|uniref:Lipoprotein n=1 Tax=Streptomyces gilvosporeus TaxID=553510 RepID=A0A1V0TL05_9ACTN|nr:hypothetical protein [Streptomyces gilvosporeus]ARF53614.1 hypothetical protein B1H19_04970 [Streptomyces gilvosporeus]